MRIGNFQYDKLHNRTSFEIRGVDLSVLNGLRRIIKTDIPYIAFRGEPFENSTVNITKNNGPLHNEFLAHRVGIIPIYVTPSQLENFNDGDLTFTLAVSNTSTKMMPVTTENMEVFWKGEKVPSSTFFPPSPITGDFHIITKLRHGEHLEMNGTAVMDTARSHVGFCPVSLCSYSFVQSPDAANLKDPLQRERAYERNEYNEPAAVVFQLETEGGLDARYLFERAIGIMYEKLQMAYNIVHDEMKWKDVVRKSEDGNGFEFVFDGETDTLGNLLQSLLHNLFIRDESKKFVKYVGYYCPHPLQACTVLKLCLTDSSQTDVNAHIEEFRRGCQHAINYLKEFMAASDMAIDSTQPVVSTKAPEVENFKPTKEAAAFTKSTSKTVVKTSIPTIEVPTTIPDPVEQEEVRHEITPDTIKLADRIAMVLRGADKTKTIGAMVSNPTATQLGTALVSSLQKRFKEGSDLVVYDVKDSNANSVEVSGDALYYAFLCAPKTKPETVTREGYKMAHKELVLKQVMLVLLTKN